MDSLTPPVEKGRPPRPSRDFRGRHRHPLTRQQSLFFATFSPDGTRLATAQHEHDRFFLCLLDTSGENLTRVFPQPGDTAQRIQTIYSLDWSPDGRSIAFSFVRDWGDRKIGIYDTLDRSFRVVADSKHDERDPRFSPDGRRLYFSSDRSGVFNVYRYDLASGLLERLTNVSGGAFMPDVSTDERRLVYANYDTAGYGIYLIDTLRTLDSVMLDAGVAAPPPPPSPRPVSAAAGRYNRFPRQFLMVPTVFSEQTVTRIDDPFKGEDVFKAGLVFYLFDPYSWIRGNELGGYFLVEPRKLFSFFDSKNIINPSVNYDFGFFGGTENLPLRIDAEYLQRGIAGEDVFISDANEQLHLQYSLSPRLFNLWVSKSLGDISNLPFTVHGIASYNWFNIHLFLKEYARSAFDYTAAKGYRLGTYVTHVNRKTDRQFWIAPRGVAIKLAYDFYEQRLQNEDERFDSQWRVNYDYYRYHQVSGSAQLGFKMPWSASQRVFADLRGTVVELTRETAERLDNRGKDASVPSFYEPVAILPGYAYYYREHLTVRGDQDSIVDTVLLSGNALTTLKLSYRFPLWPRSINRKIGFLYLDNLYGAINTAVGAAWHTPSEALRYNRSDWLTSIGAEIRLEAISFYRYPFMLGLRWDRGLNRDAPVGGDRFTFTLGFAFEDWGMLSRPDWFAAPVTRANAAAVLPR